MEKILQLIERYGLSLFIIVALGLFCWYVIIYLFKRLKAQEDTLKETMDKILDKINRTDNHENITEKLTKYAENSQKIQQLTYYLLNELSADRVSIFEYHNGGKTIMGVDFKKCTNSYEAIDLGITPKSKDYIGVPISTNFLWNKLLLENSGIYIDDIEKIREHDQSVYLTLSSLCIKSYYSLLLTEYDGTPEGFIEITYYREKISLTEIQLKILNNTAITISGLIKK